MPNVTLHLLLAEKTLADWAQEPARSPFPVDDPLLVESFRQGSLGPDLGYFPGGERLLSDLAHGFRSGDLTRSLLQTARTPLESAFAWGWATHVLADRLIHPTVGRALGEYRTGDSRVFIAGEEDTPGHVKVETGLDAWISGMNPELRKVRFTPIFDDLSIQFLSRAYGQVHRLSHDPARLLLSYRNLIRMAGRALASIAYMSGSGDLRRRRSGLLRGLASWTDRTRCPGATALAFFTPISPAEWLREEVSAVIRRFPREVARVRSDPASALPNVNLDTAQPDLVKPDALQPDPVTPDAATPDRQRTVAPVPQGC